MSSYFCRVPLAMKMFNGCMTVLNECWMNETLRKTTLDKLMHCPSEAFNAYITDKMRLTKGRMG